MRGALVLLSLVCLATLGCSTANPSAGSDFVASIIEGIASGSQNDTPVADQRRRELEEKHAKK